MYIYSPNPCADILFLAKHLIPSSLALDASHLTLDV